MSGRPFIKPHIFEPADVPLSTLGKGSFSGMGNRHENSTALLCACLGEKFVGKARLSFSPCMQKPSCLVIDHPFHESKGMCTVTGCGEWKREGDSWTFSAAIAELSDGKWKRILCFFEDQNPRLSVSARFIPWPPLDEVDKKIDNTVSEKD
jgi:hypothetical protein